MMVIGAKDVNQVHPGLLLKCKFLGPTLGCCLRVNLGFCI